MRETYLEITYRHGSVVAAYLYLPRSSRDRSARTRRLELGLIVDFTKGGKPIGIEITAPGKTTVAAVNRALRQLGFPPMRRSDLAPLLAA